MTTVVTAYYAGPSKHSTAEYARRIKAFMSAGFRCVIFTNLATYKSHFSSYPPTDTRKYALLDMNAFTVARYGWEHDLQQDHETWLGQSVHTYKVWNEKVFLVERVVNDNPYNTSVFAWVDIGIFSTVSPCKVRTFPDPAKVVPGKITILQINPFSEREKEPGLDARFKRVNRIGAGVLAGDTAAWKAFRTVYEHLLDDFDAAKVFKGKEQSVMAFAVVRHPDLFTCVPARSHGWYELLYHLA
jgi:Bacterial protein of unknown function (HtrL_YibB)